MRSYDPSLKPNARCLRQRMTDAEAALWRHLRRRQILGVRFYRLKPLGDVIVDFFAPRVGLVVEVDGGQHWEPEHREVVADVWMRVERELREGRRGWRRNPP